MRLRTKIGDAALWLPTRLWSYAAENQPDGDFSEYAADELALLLGCSLDGQAMLQALQESGFMDGMQIHDWHVHNDYHQKFSVRAKKAAEARWKKAKTGKDKTGKDKRREDKRQAMLNDSTSNASSIPGLIVPECFSKVDGFTAALAAWIDSRKKLRKPATTMAIQLMVDKLAIYPERAIDALERCILSAWQGFEWDWIDKELGKQTKKQEALYQ